MVILISITFIVDEDHFRAGYEYYYTGNHPLTWEDSSYALRKWRVGLHLYVRRGLRIVGNDLDLNDDGLPDIVLLNNEWYFRHDYQPYYLNLGGGRFSVHLWKYKSDTMTAIDAGWLGDIDGDGKLDLVIGVMEKRAMSGVLIYHDYPWDEYRRDTLAAGSVETPTVADLNNDGYLDIVAGVWRDDEEEHPDGMECSRVFYGGPEGYRSSGCLWGGGTHVVLVADFNYDTYLDVFVGSTYYGFAPVHPPRIYYGGPDGIDTARYSLVWTDPPPYDSFGTYGGTVADMNGDGWLDIVGCHNDRIFVLWGNWKGEYSPDSESIFRSEACKAVQVADLDGNGLLDIVASEKTISEDWHNGRVVLLFNYGGGRWRREELLSPGSNGILLHDFNGDGWTDIVSFEKEHDYSVVFWNLGYGKFSPGNLTLLPGTHRASRGLSVQIFGNVYDRSDTVGFLSAPITFDTAVNLYGVEVFGEVKDIKVYVRGETNGTKTPWIMVDVGKVRDYPILSGIRELEYRLTVNLNEGAGFHIDSIRFRTGPSSHEDGWMAKVIPFGNGITIYSSMQATYSVYDMAGRRLRSGRVIGTVDEIGLTRGVYYVVMEGRGISRRFRVIVR